jgi:hypothetical protein
MTGAFDIFGCRGVPELTFDLPGYFNHVIRPEKASTGDYTAFLKWVEIGPRVDFPIERSSRYDFPQNDFTLENYFSGHSEYLSFTPVLRQTPGIFKMTPPWHLSYLDKFWLDIPMLFLYRITGQRQYTPAGTWLPFFYNDKKRTFFVLPSIRLGNGERHSQAPGSIRYYYPEIKKTFRLQEDYFEGLAQTRLNGLNLANLPPRIRQQMEEDLQRQLTEEMSPPYTDAQFKHLMKRFIMRFFHYYLGASALSLFQRRQFHFKNFYHPFVCDFAKLVYNPLKGIPALMSRET